MVALRSEENGFDTCKPLKVDSAFHSLGASVKLGVGQMDTLQIAMQLNSTPVELVITCYYYIMYSYCLLVSLN